MGNIICMRTRLQYMMADSSLPMGKRWHCDDTQARMLEIQNTKIKLTPSVKRPRKKKKTV